jgi:hypothetical protein
MHKELLNEAERFLLKNWTEARTLEESMEGVRVKYAELFQTAIQAVSAAHPELDRTVSYPTQNWGSGSIAFGRAAWPASDNYEPPGLWIWNLRLEILASEDEPQPVAALYLPPKTVKKVNLDRSAARAALMKAAADLLEPDELGRVNKAEAADVLLSITTRPKTDLLNLFSAGDGQGFVDYLASEIDLLARFVPALDALLLPGDANAQPT